MRGASVCVSLTEDIDTTTPGGRLIFHVFGALAVLERDLVKKRTTAGLAAAAARGRQGGRRPVVTPHKLERARAMLAQGLKVREAATRLKIGKTALYGALANTKWLCHVALGLRQRVSPRG